MAFVFIEPNLKYTAFSHFHIKILFLFKILSTFTMGYITAKLLCAVSQKSKAREHYLWKNDQLQLRFDSRALWKYFRVLSICTFFMNSVTLPREHTMWYFSDLIDHL